MLKRVMKTNDDDARRRVFRGLVRPRKNVGEREPQCFTVRERWDELHVLFTLGSACWSRPVVFEFWMMRISDIAINSWADIDHDLLCCRRIMASRRVWLSWV